MGREVGCIRMTSTLFRLFGGRFSQGQFWNKKVLFLEFPSYFACVSTTPGRGGCCVGLLRGNGQLGRCAFGTWPSRLTFFSPLSTLATRSFAVFLSFRLYNLFMCASWHGIVVN